MATHVGSMVVEGGEARALIERVARTSCEADAWSPAAIDCMSRMTVDLSQPAPTYPKGSPERMGGCGLHLTEAQQAGVSRRFGEEVEKRMAPNGEPEPPPADDDLPPLSPPPPPPPPPPSQS